MAPESSQRRPQEEIKQFLVLEAIFEPREETKLKALTSTSWTLGECKPGSFGAVIVFARRALQEAVLRQCIYQGWCPETYQTGPRRQQGEVYGHMQTLKPVSS